MSELRDGNLIIPRAWYQNLVNQNGRSDWLAIAIVAELDFLDSTGSQTLELLSYFSELYGVSRVCVRRAIKRLRKQGILQKTAKGVSRL